MKCTTCSGATFRGADELALNQISPPHQKMWHDAFATLLDT
jgi:hypothetical protein